MSSSSRNVFDNLPGPSRIAETLVSDPKNLGGGYQDSFPALFPGYHILKKCFGTLGELRVLLDGLSEHRRRKILIASQRGACLSLENLETEWQRLADDYSDLCIVYERSSMFQRSILGRQLQADTIALESRLRQFYDDSWKTTVAGDRSINWGGMMKKNQHKGS